MLEIIENQPVRFRDPIEAESCNTECGARGDQCLLVDKYKGDWLSFQLKNKANNLMGDLGLCDQLLIYTNIFDAAGAGGGDVTVTDMTYDPVGEKFCKSAITGADMLLNVPTFTAGRTYRIRALLSNHDGVPEVRFEEDPAGSNSIYYSTNGWMDFTWTSIGASIRIIFYHAGTCCIEELEIYEYSDDISIPTTWVISESDIINSECINKFCHTPGVGNTASLETAFSILVGSRYRLNFRISGTTAGDVTLSAGSYSESFSVNGYYTRWITPTASGVLMFIPEEEFDGCVEIVEFGEQASDHIVALYNLDDTLHGVLGAGANVRDFFSFYQTMQDILDSLEALNDGCYKLCVFDASRMFSNSSDLFEGAMEFVFDPGWVILGDIAIDYNYPGRLIDIGGGTADLTLGPNPVFESNACYILEVKFIPIPDTFVYQDMLKFYVDGVEIWSSPEISGPAEAGVFRIPFTTGAIGSQDFQLYSEVGVGNRYDLEYIRLYRDPACGVSGAPDFCSQCISVKSDTVCEKQLSASMDFGTDESGAQLMRYAYGFQWDGIFFPMFRTLAEFHIPKYPSDAEDYLNAIGDHKVTGGVLEKKWDFAVASFMEGDMDALRMMVRCDSFNVYIESLDVEDSGHPYFCSSKEIAGAWPKKDKPSTADIEFELQRRRGDGLFYRNSF